MDKAYFSCSIPFPAILFIPMLRTSSSKLSQEIKVGTYPWGNPTGTIPHQRVIPSATLCQL